MQRYATENSHFLTQTLTDRGASPVLSGLGLAGGLRLPREASALSNCHVASGLVM